MTFSSATLWAVILAMGIGTFALRFSLLGLSGYVKGLPTRAEQALRFVPAAVIAALVFPSLFVVDGALSIAGNDRLLAGAIAAPVAWRTEDILTTIVVGLGALLVLQAVF